MPVEVLRELARRLPDVRLWNLYGQTEIAPLATMLGPDDQLRKPGSCGRAVLNVETRVVDDAMRDVAARRSRRDRAPLAAAAAGLLPRRRAHGGRVRGRLVPLGRPGDDRRRGLHHGRRPQEGHDQDRRRERRQPRGRGGDLPAADSVSEVAVVGLPHPRWVEAVVAVVVVQGGPGARRSAVLAHCAHSLAAGFKRPSAWSSSRRCRRTRAASCSSANCERLTRVFSRTCNDH